MVMGEQYNLYILQMVGVPLSQDLYNSVQERLPSNFSLRQRVRWPRMVHFQGLDRLQLPVPMHCFHKRLHLVVRALQCQHQRQHLRPRHKFYILGDNLKR